MSMPTRLWPLWSRPIRRPSAGAARPAPAAERGCAVEQLERRVLMATGTFGTGLPVYIYSDPTEVPTRASRYGSMVIVRDLEGPIRDVRVTLVGFAHTAPEDVDILLMSPTGKSVILMSDAGSQFAVDPAVNITFADDASRDLPEFDQIRGGVYRPTNYDDVEQSQQPFPYPAPEPPYGTSLSDLAGDDPTPEDDGSGRWFLYITDDGPFGDDGGIDGWELTITTGGAGPAAPSAPDLASTSDTGASNTDNVTRDDTPTFRGTAAAGTEVRLFANGVQVGTSPITGGAYAITPTLSEGTFAVTARAVDAEGNEGAASAEVTLTIDTTPPPTPAPPDLTPASDTGPSSSDNVTSDTTPTFSGLAPESSSVSLITNGRPVGTAPVAADGTYNVTVGTALAAGSYDFLVAPVDLAGNSGSPSGALTVQIQSVVIESGTVSQVFLGGSGLNSGTVNADFRTAAGLDPVYGYPVPAGANQLKSIPWVSGINTIAIRLAGLAGPLEQNDLQVRGVTVASYSFTGFLYDAATRTGVWTLPQAVTNDKLRLVLAAAAVPGLDGEWTDGADTYPSGDGTAGGDFRFRVNVLGGDATGDGQVNAQDLSYVKQRLNKTATNPGTTGAVYSIFGDVTADGRINAQDLSAVKQRLNRRLPTADPLATSLLFSSTPVSA